MTDATQESVELNWAAKTVKATGGNLLSIFTVVLMACMTVGVYFHYEDSKVGRAEFIGALKEMSAATRDQTKVAREQNCLFRFPSEERQKWADWCKQNS